MELTAPGQIGGDLSELDAQKAVQFEIGTRGDLWERVAWDISLYNIELWDEDVKNCTQSFSPIFNRCVVFETNEISFHGVSAVKCPADRSRKSFAA